MKRAWVLGSIALLILAFALATGHPMFWRTFYVFGLLLLLSALWVVLMARGVSAEVRRPATRSHAGGKIVETVIVRRRSRFLQGVYEVSERTDMPSAAPSALVGIAEGQSAAVELTIPCPRRGVYQLGPAEISATDPFGLFQWRRLVGNAQRLVVYPATVDLPGFTLLPADLPGEGPRHVRSHNVTTSAFGVRDYNLSDSFNRISWKATAHHSRLMVKEFEVEPANNIWVLVDMERKVHTGAGDASTEETAVTLAASVCTRYLNANYPVGFLAQGNHFHAIPPQRGSGQTVRVLDALAGLHAGGTAPLLDVLAELHVKAGRYTSVAIITPSTSLEWLEGVRHLLERRCRVSAVVIDADLHSREHPVSAQKASSMGVPTYTVKRGAEAAGGLVSLTPEMRPLESRFAHAAGAR